MALNINIPSQVVQVANYAALPATGAVNKIYITIDTDFLYRWTGSTYEQVGGGGGGGGTWGSITGTLSNQTDLQNALDAKVPYTGAIANVDLGEYELKAGQIELDQSPTGTAGVAVTQWNNTIGTSQTTLKGGNVVLKNGIDLVARVVNNTGIQLTKAAYQVVKIQGAQGQRLAIGLAQANNDNNSADTLGVVIETIANNQEGFVITVGQIEDVNTTGSLQSETWNDGDVLYLSPTVAGRITNVKPNGSTGHIVVIGYVEYAHANHGKIYVKVMNGWELDELHNVYINPSTQANNDALIYESSTGLWKNKTIATALGYTPANQTTTISTSSPLSGGGDLSANRTLSIADAAADGVTKGAATFTDSDFNSASGVISIDYANGQSASSTNKGFLTSADWSTFNAKQDALVSSTNIKTINGNTLLGSGDLTIAEPDQDYLLVYSFRNTYNY